MQFMEVYGEHRASKFGDDDVHVDVNGGSLADRRASKRGRNGFNIAMARCPLGSSMVRSPFLTIPSGFSPTVLLDSPIMLLNTHDIPSPTTGTFPIHSIKDENSLLNPIMLEDGSSYGSEDSYYRFTPRGELRLENQEGETDHYQGVESEKTLMDYELLAEFPKEGCSVSEQYELGSSSTDKNNVETCLSSVTHNQDIEQPAAPPPPPLETEHKGSYVPVGMLKTSEDGYNWRKYGQKQVKGSEYPRSYYKCTHPNCIVKKKVERSLDGQITEIIYTGAHNHSKPDPTRRAVLGSVLAPDDAPDTGEGGGSRAKLEGALPWRNSHYGVKDWSVDGLERTSSVSAVTELSEPLYGKTVGGFESIETPELSSTLASHDDDDGGGGGNDDDELTNQGSISADDAEPELKRRRKEGISMETSLGSRSVREQRVVVQIETEFDILEDGYRWRKYGQKVVKGNPNPRSYYKCTSAGCSVRKHVERASHDLKCVITTYEGKHNHLVPAARNSSSSSSSSSSSTAQASSAATATQAAAAPTRKSETQIQDLSTRFYPTPEFSSHEYQRSFGTAPPFCQLKFPPLQTAFPALDFPISLPLSQNLSAFQVFLAERFLTPKQEHEEDNIYASFQAMTDTSSGSSSSSVSSVYQQVMGKFP
ncbi:putative WRKY transcription factor 2, partial [Cucurbita argyrosperma subsp. sororia]